MVQEFDRTEALNGMTSQILNCIDIFKEVMIEEVQGVEVPRVLVCNHNIKLNHRTLTEFTVP